MFTVSYSLTLGPFAISSGDDPRTELVAVETLLTMLGPGDTARAALYLAPAPRPGLLEQLAGAAAGAAAGALGLGGSGPAAEPAFSVEVRGKQVKLGDELRLELACGDERATVYTGEISAIASGLERTTFVARSGAQRLADTRVNQAYLNQSVGQIVRDLCGQAGVQVGEVEGGASYAYLVAHESQNLLRTIGELARREGLDLYFGPDNRLNLRRFRGAGPDHTLYYGIDILALELHSGQPGSAQVTVYGESPASSQGNSAWHWLTKDGGTARGRVGAGPRALALADGALRTRAAAGDAAAARLGALKDGAAQGRLRLVGRPSIAVGQAIAIKAAPKAELNGLFKVTTVRHLLSKGDGFVTLVGFSGQGGAAQAGGLAGALGGAAAGAAGALGL